MGGGRREVANGISTVVGTGRIESYMHRNRRTMHSSFHGQHGQRGGSRARAPSDDDDDDAQNGGHLSYHTMLALSAYSIDIGHPCYGRLTAFKGRGDVFF